MNALRRLTIALLLATAAVVIPAARESSVTHAAGRSGQWNVLIVQQCDRNAANQALCDQLLRPYLGRLLISFQAFCDASAQCSFTEVLSYLGIDSRAPACGLSVTITPFSSFCTLVYSGSATIGQSGPVPTFRALDDTLYFYGNPFADHPVLTIPHPGPSYPFDLGIPAIPGVFPNTTQNLQLLGGLPAGVNAPPGTTFAGVIAQQSTPGPVALWYPLPVAISGLGSSNAFVVGWFSSHAGYGQVNFGSGPGCSGLVETATSDLVPHSTAHLIVVSGNDLPGTVGDIGILPGATYRFQTQTSYPGGNELDTNGGTCYAATVPKP